MNNDANNIRSLAAVITDLKEELKQFLQTRIEILKSELQEKAKGLKAALPLAVAGALLLGTAYILITLALVGAVAGALHANTYRWAIAFGASEFFGHCSAVWPHTSPRVNSN